LRIIAAAMLWFAAAAVAEEKCAPTDILYMALEPMQELLGMRGETRQQFLDRSYPGWQAASAEIVSASAEEAGIRVALKPPAPLALARAELIAEARVEFVEAGDRRAERVGHREIARYPLEADVSAEIVVPRSVFREPGALLVVLHLRRTDVAGAQGVMVHAVPVEATSCPRRVYTHDRFSAIRLNRAGKK
jgi:hypothetical protein